MSLLAAGTEESNTTNEGYLRTKVAKLGHILSLPPRPERDAAP